MRKPLGHMQVEFNVVAITLIIALFFLWKLDLITTLLNLKSLSPEVPDEFKGVYDEDKYAKSQDYTRASARFEVVSSAISLTGFLVFWFFGGFRFLDDLARGLGGSILTMGLVYIAAIALLNHLFRLPFEIYDTFVLEERFGFNKTTPKTFFADQIKSLFLLSILGLPVVAGILWIFLEVPNAWLWAWVSFTCFTLLLTYLAPAFILPLFNKFEPMPDGELKQAIEAMAKKVDFPLTEVSIMDGSKRSAKSNAFFTGFGKNKKIALYDNLIEQQTTEELVAVLAHEIGHFKCKHIVQRIALSIVQTGVIFFLLGLIVGASNVFSEKLFDAFGVIPSVHVGLVLFMVIFGPVSRLLSVAMNAWSRKHEFEADAYAAKAQQNSAHLVSALKKLSTENLSNLTPHPLNVFLNHSHPPVTQRIAALRGGGLQSPRPSRK
jgi:STE24 endopeptidase